MPANPTAIGSVVPTWAGGSSGPTDACLIEASFVDGDLAAGVYTFAHGLDAQYVVLQVMDNNDLLIVPDSVDFTAAGTADVDLTSYRTLTGTWKVVATGPCA